MISRRSEITHSSDVSLERVKLRANKRTLSRECTTEALSKACKFISDFINLKKIQKKGGKSTF